MSENSTALAAAIERFQVALSSPEIELLDRYCCLLWEWNARMNLTRHDTYEKFVARDLVDTLAFGRHLEAGERVLDVGTGGGVPGVLLAMLRPDLDVVVSESVAKKARAVEDIVRQLDLPVSVFAGRAESALAHKSFNTLLVRAVAPLPKLLRWFAPHWRAFDRLLVLKGPNWVKERGEARHLGLLQGMALRRVEEYRSPGTDALNVMLQICPEERLLDDRTCRLEDRRHPAAPLAQGHRSKDRAPNNPNKRPPESRAERKRGHSGASHRRGR